MKTEQAIKRAKQILGESMIYFGVVNLLKWDMGTYMPATGREWRVQTSTYLSSKQSCHSVLRSCQSHEPVGR